MSINNKHILAFSISAAALIASASVMNAQAGGFSLREQSTEFQGTSFAGDAAGGALSSMFWNPAAAAAKDGINTESNYTFVLPDSQVTANGGAFFAEGYKANSGSYAPNSAIPASYANYQVNDRLYLGLALNSPYGLTTSPSNEWAGSPIENTTKIFDIDINPNVAYKLTPNLTIGAGLQIEYFKIYESSGGGALPSFLGGFLSPITWTGRSATLDGWGVGATAGAIWKPTETTTLGFGYRSEVSIDLAGSCHGSSLTTAQAQGVSLATIAGGGSLPNCTGPITSNTVLPETLSWSARQQVTERFALLGTIEYQNWSELKPSLAYNSAGARVDATPVSFKDDWLYAIGAEYKYSPLLTLRTGLSYEHAPVSDSIRTQFLPDADRWTPSVGASYKWSDRITVDFAYSHVFFKNAPIFESFATPVGTLSLLSADAKTNIDLVSVGVKYRLAGPAALESLK